ncbi:D-alanyl-D-alanine carboxypeptidase/D-alanyl-D-alanine-endopeptidase [candidate division KSB1 bacterium]|nr:D-alanyl-D-alanine carboxypeptidase/D-alanyl-D-alanine-endopeptidase [candidate division KSB1 bacterium]
MVFRKLGILNLAAFLFLTACTQHPPLLNPPPPVDRLTAEIRVIFDDPAFANAFWGVLIQSLDNGEIIFRENEYKGFLPSSNMKLFTSAAAFALLPRNFRFQTQLFHTGYVDEDSILQGDLIIRGVGDPSLGRQIAGESDQTNGNLSVFYAWADSITLAGIKAISGKIIGDDNYFEDEPLGRGWAWDDQSYCYSAQISALSFHENCIDLVLMPADSIGGIAACRILPDANFIEVECKVKTTGPGTESRIFCTRKPNTNHVLVEGCICIEDSEVVENATIDNPTKYAACVFKTVLEARGFPVEGPALDIDELTDFSYTRSDTNRLVDYQSPPIKEIIKTTNKSSQNLYAELIFRTLSVNKSGMGDQKLSAQQIEDFLSGIGINPGHIIIADGSGLSRRNLVTPKQITALLRYIHSQPYFNDFYESLPIAGVDGTLKNRMRGTRAEGNVRAKTGTLGGVAVLSGYVTSEDGELFAFSMIANNHTVPVSLVRQAQDLVCERLANFSRNKAF